MISLEEAQTRLFGLRDAVAEEHVPLGEAAGRWAAEDVLALRTQPARDLSAMDGYAIRHADLPGPWALIGESAAGKRFSGTVRAGQAVRIFTGAVVPDGADCILIQENATVDSGQLVLTDEAPSLGKHIRRAGGDFAEGSVLVKTGERLTPPRLALAAMGGHGIVPVRRKLRVSVISTGDELVPPGQPCDEDQIPSSNAVMLAAMLASYPAELDVRPIVRDDLTALTEEFDACRGSDLIVSIGGASVGDHDLARPALEAAGARLDFWKIAMRPGKPVMAGMLDETVVLGLPGNPVSAYVTAILLMLPLVSHLSGAGDALPPRGKAFLGAPLPVNGPRLDHVRATLDGTSVTPAGQNDSAMLFALATSHVLIVRPANAPPAEMGTLTEIVLLPN